MREKKQRKHTSIHLKIRHAVKQTNRKQIVQILKQKLIKTHQKGSIVGFVYIGRPQTFFIQLLKKKNGKYDFDQIRLEAGTWLIVCKEGNPIPSVKRLSAQKTNLYSTKKGLRLRLFRQQALIFCFQEKQVIFYIGLRNIFCDKD